MSRIFYRVFSRKFNFFFFSYGCCLFCCCCKDQLPPKAKQLKSALESIETYRAQQLEKLRDNYAQQVNDRKIFYYLVHDFMYFFLFFRANGFDKIVLCKWKEFVKITIFKFKIFEISVNTVQVK